MKTPLNAITDVIEVLLRTSSWKATKYLSDKQIVRATRRTHGRKFNERDNVEIVLTIGKPNFADREFLKTCKKVGEPFPVKKIQTKPFPKKRSK